MRVQRRVRPVLLVAAVAHLDRVVDELARLRARADLVDYVVRGRLVGHGARGRICRLRGHHLVVGARVEPFQHRGSAGIRTDTRAASLCLEVQLAH